MILYRKVRLEEFAPYIRPDGLVKRLTTYQDEECEVHRQETGSNAAVRRPQPLMSDSVCVC